VEEIFKLLKVEEDVGFAEEMIEDDNDCLVEDELLDCVLLEELLELDCFNVLAVEDDTTVVGFVELMAVEELLDSFTLDVDVLVGLVELLVELLVCFTLVDDVGIVVELDVTVLELDVTGFVLVDDVGRVVELDVTVLELDVTGFVLELPDCLIVVELDDVRAVLKLDVTGLVLELEIFELVDVELVDEVAVTDELTVLDVELELILLLLVVDI
jgi:hypothetical protein